MKLDKFIVALTISIFLIAGVFSFGYELYAERNANFNLYGLVPAAFLGWATYDALGGGAKGVIEGILSNMSGVLWSIVIILIWDYGFDYGLFGAFVSVAIGAGAMVFQAHIKLLKFVPGTFIGASAFFALGASINGTTLWPTVLGLLLGVFLGLISDLFAKYLDAKTTTKKTP